MKTLLRMGYRMLRIYWFFRRPVTVGVRVVLIRAGTVLLVRHTYQDAWYLPGGGVKGGERLDQAIRREAQEEAGVSLKASPCSGSTPISPKAKTTTWRCFIATLSPSRGDRTKR